MGDEQQRQRRALAAAPAAPAGSAPARRRRASRPARRRSARPARARARRRSPRAGAGRRRAGAGSGRGSAPASARRPPAPARTRAGVLGLRHALHHQRLGDDRAHAQARIQRLVRVLEDHLHAPAQRRAGSPCRAPRRRRRSTAPPAGGTSPSIARASVDLPAARLPDDAQHLAAAATRATRRRRRRRPAPKWTARSRTSISARSSGLLRDQHRLRPALPGREVAGGRLRRARPRAAAAPPGTRSAAYGQRGRNAQPSGGSAGSGGAARDRRRPAPRAPPITGSESSSRFVYGCCGRANTASTGPLSTIRPAYMTAIRSQVSASTARSWLIRISASPSSRAQPLEQLEDLRLHDHVERGRRLVGDHQRRAGRRAPARSSPAGAGRRRAGARSDAPSPRRQPDRAEQLGDPRAHVGRLRLRLVQPDRRGDLALDALAPGRASSSRPGRRARRGASARAACPRSVRRSMLIGSSPPGGRSVIVPACSSAGGSSRISASAVVRLAAARLARQPERLAARERQVDAVDDRVAAVADREPGDLEQRAHRCVPQPRVDVLLEQVAEHRHGQHERA